MELKIRPLEAPLGAEIIGFDPVLVSDLDPTTHAAIVRALYAHRVLIFRGRPRPDASLVGFAERFGSLVTLYEHGTTVPGHPGIVRVSNVREHGQPIGLAGEQEIPWHHDHSYLACPAKESFLEATEIPERAPRTSFVDMVAALEALPDALRRRMRGLRAVHHIDGRERDDSDPEGLGGRTGATPDYEDETNVLAQERIAAQRTTHPLVVRHPGSGLEALYVSPLATHEIVGLSAADSKALLDELFERAIRPEFIYSHAWSSGDFVVWDSIATLHHREAFDARDRRLMKQMSTRCESELEAAA
jgi:taurine dioxygenase